MEISPIAHIYTPFKEKFGIPRQSGRASNIEGQIVFAKKFRNPDALREIEGFSHLWLIFDFSKSHTAEFIPTVRPPRLGGNRKVGVFASRSPFRPNSMGLSVVKLVRVEHTENKGDILIVSGMDLLDGTPIYDIKPYLPYCDCIPEASYGYTADTHFHSLEVKIGENVKLLPDRKTLDEIIAVIADDPRPSYQNDGRVYKMRYGDFDVSFKVLNKNAEIIDIISLIC